MVAALFFCGANGGRLIGSQADYHSRFRWAQAARNAGGNCAATLATSSRE
jgi:hypothetical protein